MNLSAEIGTSVFTKLGHVMEIRTVLMELMRMKICVERSQLVQRMSSHAPMDNVSKDICNVLEELTVRIIAMRKIAVIICFLRSFNLIFIFRHTRAQV